MLNRKPIKLFLKRGHRAILALCFAALCAVAPSVCSAQEAAAVLAKGSGLYFETFLAFQKALGRPITPIDLSAKKPRLPQELKVVAAFGSLAAAYEYPSGIKIIYLLAPGYTPKNPDSGATGISPLPDPAQAVAAFKGLQPGLKRLAVFMAKPPPGLYISELTAAARPYGIEILPVSLGGPVEFPDKLRDLRGKIDALWLLPEPALINRTALMVLAEFSCSGKLPFYAPSAGLSELGAAAAFAPDFTQTGAAAAAALDKALAGEQLPEIIYVRRSELTVNEAFILKCGLPVKLPASGEARR